MLRSFSWTMNIGYWSLWCWLIVSLVRRHKQLLFCHIKVVDVILELVIFYNDSRIVEDYVRLKRNWTRKKRPNLVRNYVNWFTMTKEIKLCNNNSNIWREVIFNGPKLNKDFYPTKSTQLTDLYETKRTMWNIMTSIKDKENLIATLNAIQLRVRYSQICYLVHLIGQCGLVDVLF